MAKRLRIDNPMNFNPPTPGALKGTIAGVIRFRTTQNGGPKVYIKGLTPAGNPKPTYRFPKGQSGNPKYRP